MIVVRILVTIGLILGAVVAFNYPDYLIGSTLVIATLIWTRFGHLAFFIYDNYPDIPGFDGGQYSLDLDPNYDYDEHTGRYYQREPDGSTMCDNCRTEYSGLVCPECQSHRLYRPIGGNSHIYKY